MTKVRSVSVDILQSPALCNQQFVASTFFSAATTSGKRSQGSRFALSSSHKPWLLA